MRVLYICTGNSFRSPVAEALTRKYHPSFEAESAGTRIAGEVAENAREFLEEEGALQHAKPRPDQLTQRAVDQADVIVCMRQHHADFLEENFRTEGKEVRVWEVRDPIHPDVESEEAFGLIKEKVKKILP